MSIEAMKRIKSLLQDCTKIDSHTISTVVAECDMAILAKQPATGEPVAWMHWLNGPVRVFMNKDVAMMELDRLNREYPLDADDRKMRPLVFGDTAQQPATGEPGVWPLRAQVWKRESTQEWVLEIEGTLGDTDMNIRHTQPLSVAYENVPGLPTIYTHPAPSVPGEFVEAKP